MRVQAQKINDLYFRLIGTPIVGFFIPILFFNIKFENIKENWITILFSIFYTGVYWTICRSVFIWGDKRYPELKDNKKRMIFVFVVCAAFILSFCNIVNFCFETYFSVPVAFIPSKAQINGASFVSFLTISATYEASRYFILWKKTIVEKEALAKANLQSHLEGLKNQVNPHFLFNSLNTLSSLIDENPTQANEFVQKLSSVYRYVLTHRDKETVLLQDEVEFIKSYIFLNKIRFGENLNIHINLTSACLALNIPTLTLQMLVENAIKHNIISANKPLTVHINCDDEYIVVTNNLQAKLMTVESSGIGLSNIVERYKYLTKKPVFIQKTDIDFSVKVPLV